MTVFVRFAPSPTGYIHIGNLRTALFNWLFAAREGGRFLLRFDDTDAERSRAEYAEAIVEDLAWIGMTPHVTLRQSDRVGLYDTSADRLRDRGLLYPCYETPDELDRRRKRLMGRGLPPVYGREALKLAADDHRRMEAEGRRPHWRFLLPNFEADPLQPRRTIVEWDDLVRGPQSVDLASLSDPVLVREDGSYLYTLPSVVDDGELGISHVIRGDDHVTNTGVQIALFEALGFVPPRFGHHNLLTTVGGEGLSKRSGSLSLRTLRAEGYEPMAVASLAVEVGMAGSIEALASLDALGRRLDLSSVSQSAAKFDPAELDRLSAELVHAKPHADVAEALRGYGVPADESEAFWRAVAGNCARVSDAEGWASVVYRGPAAGSELPDEDRQFVRAAFDSLPEGAFGPATWKDWTNRLKAETGRKGRGLFMPLRLALTGLDHGPEMSELLPLMGRERTLARRP